MPITTTPSGGPQGEFSTYTPIYSTTLSSATSSITFSNIPTTYTDLVLSVSELNSTATNTSFQFRVGSNTIDTGANYALSELFGTGSTAGYDRASNDTAGYLNGPGIGTSTTIPNIYIMNFMNYSNITTFKTILGRGGSANLNLVSTANLWRSTLPINTITIFQSLNNMASGTTVTLYGIKAAAPAPKATGGDLVYTDNTYWYHVFNNSGIFDVKTAMNVDYLVVAGGGGGSGGGGGAGGYRTSVGTSGGGASAESVLALSPIQYAVTVGAGGSGVAGSVGVQGNNSVISTITSIGGGGGGGSLGGGTGGSGGGGNSGSNKGSGTANQGYDGGLGPNGGGGGAGAVGGNFNNTGSVGGNGGNGVSSSISSSSVTRAGGGGGSGGGDGTAGTGGSGGGGNGAKGALVGSNGSTNTGSGGGGGGTGPSPTYTSYAGGSGGSGVVIVRYAV